MKLLQPSKYMIAVNLQCSDNFISEARYVFKTFFTILGIEYNETEKNQINDFQPEILIYYGSQPIVVPEKTFLIHIKDCLTDSEKAIPLLAKLADKSNSSQLPQKMHYLFRGDLPGLENIWYQSREDNTPLISANKRAICCAIDIIATAFYFLSLKNELQSKERDNLNRFKKIYSDLGEEIYDSPVVDQYYSLFAVFLKKGLKEDLKIKQLWPGNHTFCLGLSHDVDSLPSWSFTKIKHSLFETEQKRTTVKLLKKSVDIIKSVSAKDNWSGNFNFITDMENQFEGSSTFFMASNHRTRIDPNYSLKWKRINEGLEVIKRNKNSIGLHGTIPSSENEAFLKEEKTLLEHHAGNKIIGNRQHYLRFDINKTFDIIEKAGFGYDSTFGFDSELGYRCGTTLPFQPFSIKEKRAYSFWEIPLILMDTVLLLDKNFNLSGEKAWVIVEEYLENAYNNGFCLTINWHNTIISSANYLGYTSLYKKILNWAFEKNAWICSLDDLYNWWIKRLNNKTMEY